MIYILLKIDIQKLQELYKIWTRSISYCQCLEDPCLTSIGDQDFKTDHLVIRPNAVDIGIFVLEKYYSNFLERQTT